MERQLPTPKLRTRIAASVRMLRPGAVTGGVLVALALFIVFHKPAASVDLAPPEGNGTLPPGEESGPISLLALPSGSSRAANRRTASRSRHLAVRRVARAAARTTGRSVPDAGGKSRAVRPSAHPQAAPSATVSRRSEIVSLTKPAAPVPAAKLPSPVQLRTPRVTANSSTHTRELGWEAMHTSAQPSEHRSCETGVEGCGGFPRRREAADHQRALDAGSPDGTGEREE
jgi:hypothetical protein